MKCAKQACRSADILLDFEALCQPSNDLSAPYDGQGLGQINAAKILRQGEGRVRLAMLLQN
eukprot:5936753-Karenia_brevis.AAC.1